MTYRRRPVSVAVPLMLLAAGSLCAQPSRGGAPPMFPVGNAGAAVSMESGIPGGAVRFDGDTPETGRKNVGLGVLYSLLLPGMGELYAGSYGSGKYFTAVEGVLWLGLGAIDIRARSMRDDARSFAALHAGFDQAGKDDAYYINAGNFTDVWSYNEQVLRDRDAYKLYDPMSSSYWKWDSDANRERFRLERVASDEMFNNTRFVVAAIAINHLMSAINAARLIVSGNRALPPEGDLGIGASVMGGPGEAHGIAVSVTRRF